MDAETRIPQEVAEAIGYYVYALRDPRNKRVFYVGKGLGPRINSHVADANNDPQSERAKLRAIREIEDSGSPVDLLFLRYGIADEASAFMVEQAVIDAFAADQHPLTNLVRGHKSGSHGLATLPAVVQRYRADECPAIDARVIMVKIQRGWRPDMNEREIFGTTRGHWNLSESARQQAQYCLGVAGGVVRGAYRIDSWFRSTRPDDEGKNRWGFEGSAAPELAHVVGTQVRDVFPNQVMYRRFLDGYPGPLGDT